MSRLESRSHRNVSMWENPTPAVCPLTTDFRPLTSDLRLAVSPLPRVVPLCLVPSSSSAI